MASPYRQFSEPRPLKLTLYRQAWDDKQGCTVTRASLNPEYLGTPGEHAFREKAQLLAIFDHPRSIEILDIEKTGNDLCMVTEVVDGVDLATVIQQAAISAQDFEALVEDTLSWAVAWENYSDRDVIIEAADVKLDWPSASCFVFKVCDFTLVEQTAKTGKPDQPRHRHLIASLLRLYRSALTGHLSDGTPAQRADTEMAATHARELRQQRPDLADDRLRWLHWAELPATAGGPQSADQVREKLYRSAKSSHALSIVGRQAPPPTVAPAADFDEAKPAPIEDTAPVPLHVLHKLGRPKQTEQAQPNGAQPSPIEDTPPPPVKAAIDGSTAGSGQTQARPRTGKRSRRRNITPIPLTVDSSDTASPESVPPPMASPLSAEHRSPHRHRTPAASASASAHTNGSHEELQSSPQLPRENPRRWPFHDFSLTPVPLKLGIAAGLAAGLLLAFILFSLTTLTKSTDHSIVEARQAHPAQKAPPSNASINRTSPEVLTQVESPSGQAKAPNTTAGASSASTVAAPADTADTADTKPAQRTGEALAVAAPADALSGDGNGNGNVDADAEVRSAADAATELTAILEAIARHEVAGLETGPGHLIVQRLAQLLQLAADGQPPLPAADIDRAIAACFSNRSEFTDNDTDLLELAANQFNSLSAKRLMADMLRSSEGEAVALPWTLMAAEAGDVESMLAAGTFLMSKQGRQSPHAGEAVKWLGRAAGAGHRDGIYYFAECLLLGKGVPRDEATAIDLLTSAEADDDARAADLLGVCYSRGLGGLEVDTVRAAALFEKAVRLGNHSALANLAVFYLNGTGVEKNDARAMALLQQGVEQKNPACLLIYARCLENGLGVEMNLDEARRWYRLAAEAGNRHAAQHLK